MNKLLILMVGLVLVGGVGFVVMSQMKGPATPAETTSEETGAAKAMIEIKGYKYSPPTLTVKPGETVWVTNKDLIGHTVTSDDGSSFDTGIISQNGTVSFTAPDTAGTYGYNCTPHPYMKGTLIVQ